MIEAGQPLPHYIEKWMHRALATTHELAEAQSEIERHHDLISELRDLLSAWQSLEALLPEQLRVAIKKFRLNERTLEILNREVGRA